MTPFPTLLEFFERHGWRLLKVVGSQRVFVKQEGSPYEPYIVTVYEGGGVETEVFQRAKEYLDQFH